MLKRDLTSYLRADSARNRFACLLAPLAVLPVLAGYIALLWILNGAAPFDDFDPFGVTVVLLAFGLILAYLLFALFGYPVCLYLRTNGFSSYLLHGLAGGVLGVCAFFLFVSLDLLTMPEGAKQVDVLALFVVTGASILLAFRRIAGWPVE